jgi:intein/homing endonuclease
VEDIDTYFTSEILVHNIPPRKCFTGDTMITLADGTYHKIKHIELGAKIKTYDEETGKLKDSVVLEVVKVLHDNLVKYKFDDNTEIKATDDHPFYTDGDYRPLEVGDEVLNDELNKIKVVSVEKVDGLIETYNINKTNNGKNYFANRVLVSDESDT